MGFQGRAFDGTRVLGAGGREALLAELARYVCADAREHEMLAATARFISEHEACFERTLQVGHVTASAWVVDYACSQVLLTHHRKLGKWLQLGGHADGNSDARAVAMREAREESGLSSLRFARRDIYDIDVHEIPARADEPAHLHHDLRFAFFADSGEAPVVSGESHDVRWVALEAVEALTIDASVRRLLAKTPRLFSAARARPPA